MHDFRVATLSAIINQELCLPKDINFFSDYKLQESLYELKTHKAIVRAIERLKERNEPIMMLTVYKFLKEHGIPKSITEENQLLEVFSGNSLTKETFIHYIQELKKHNLKRFRI